MCRSLATDIPLKWYNSYNNIVPQRNPFLDNCLCIWKTINNILNYLWTYFVLKSGDLLANSCLTRGKRSMATHAVKLKPAQFQTNLTLRLGGRENIHSLAFVCSTNPRKHRSSPFTVLFCCNEIYISNKSLTLPRDNVSFYIDASCLCLRCLY